MFERLFLASTVTCLLYLSLQLGQSSVTTNPTNSTASLVPVESSLVSDHNHNFPNFTVAQK